MNLVISCFINPDAVFVLCILQLCSGGTDIIACFMGHNWTMPVHRGQIQCMMLGCDMETWNDDGLLTEFNRCLPAAFLDFLLQ